jgi:glycosyltransferase involved in cell wall biosynthesis
VIPVYNRAELIRRALDSVLAQTFGDFECIVSDNHSSDGTLTVANEYADLDSRIRVISQTANIGPVRNWLAGAAASKGEFVKILFSDDWMEPDCLARAMKAFEDHPSIGFVYFNAEVEGGLGKSAQRKEGKESGTSFIWRSLAASSCRYSVPVSPTAGVFRTESIISSLNRSIESLTGSDYLETGAGPDQAIYLHAADCYLEIYFLNRTLAHYGLNKCSITVESGVRRPGHLLSNYYKAQLLFLRDSAIRRTTFGFIAKLSVIAYALKIIFRYRIAPSLFNYLNKFR